MLKQSETLRIYAVESLFYSTGMVLTFSMVVNGLPLRKFSTICKAIEVWLKIIVSVKLIQPVTKLFPLLKETDELLLLLFHLADTAKKQNDR